jgi:hypothetical protein
MLVNVAFAILESRLLLAKVPSNVGQTEYGGGNVEEQV